MHTTTRRTAALAMGAVIALATCPGAIEPAHAKKGKGGRDAWAAQAYANAPPEATGRVEQLLVNPFGEVDGLVLDHGVLVTFPKHMGRQLASTVKRGDSVEVKGAPEAPGQVKGYVVTNRRTNRSVVVRDKPWGEVKVPGHIRRMGLKPMRADGKVRHLRHGKRGEVNGLVLSDGTVVRFPKHVSYRFASLFQVGQEVSASGYGTQNGNGRALEVTALGPAGSPPEPIYPNQTR